MNTDLSTALSGFASSINALIPVTTILQVMGITIGASFSIFLVIFGAKRIISSVKDAIHGQFPETSYEFKNSSKAKKIAESYGYLNYEDYVWAQKFDYDNAKDFYDDQYSYETNFVGNVKNRKYRIYLNRQNYINAHLKQFDDGSGNWYVDSDIDPDDDKYFDF